MRGAKEQPLTTFLLKVVRGEDFGNEAVEKKIEYKAK